MRLDREPEVRCLDPVDRRQAADLLGHCGLPLVRFEVLDDRVAEDHVERLVGEGAQVRGVPLARSRFACMRASASRLTRTTSTSLRPAQRARLPEGVRAADVEDAEAAASAEPHLVDEPREGLEATGAVDVRERSLRCRHSLRDEDVAGRQPGLSERAHTSEIEDCHQRTQRRRSRGTFAWTRDDYVDRYHHRPHSRLTYRTPREVAATWKDHDDQLTPTAKSGGPRQSPSNVPRRATNESEALQASGTCVDSPADTPGKRLDHQRGKRRTIVLVARRTRASSGRPSTPTELDATRSGAGNDSAPTHEDTSVQCRTSNRFDGCARSKTRSLTTRPGPTAPGSVQISLTARRATRRTRRAL